MAGRCSGRRRNKQHPKERLTREDLLVGIAHADHSRGGQAERAGIRREMRLKALARARWAGDEHLARRLLVVWPEASGYVSMRGGRVIMHDPAEFKSALSKATRAGVERRARAEEAETHGHEGEQGGSEANSAGARRVAQMWRPHAARQQFSAVAFWQDTGRGEQRRPTHDLEDMFAEV